MIDRLTNMDQRLRVLPKRHAKLSISDIDHARAHLEVADQTHRSEALCAHFGMTPTRNNTGVAHENGAIESQHGHLKRTVVQALLLRGSVDFESLEAYRGWIANLIGRRNARRPKMVQLECTALQPAAVDRLSHAGADL